MLHLISEFNEGCWSDSTSKLIIRGGTVSVYYFVSFRHEAMVYMGLEMVTEYQRPISLLVFFQ